MHDYVTALPLLSKVSLHRLAAEQRSSAILPPAFANCSGPRGLRGARRALLAVHRLRRRSCRPARACKRSAWGHSWAPPGGAKRLRPQRLVPVYRIDDCTSSGPFFCV